MRESEVTSWIAQLHSEAKDDITGRGNEGGGLLNNMTYEVIKDFEAWPVRMGFDFSIAGQRWRLVA